MLVTLTNDTCIKYSMVHQAYKVVNTHAHEISGWKILSILLHAHTPNLGGINVDVQSDLSKMEFKNIEQLEYFHSIILRLQQCGGVYIFYREAEHFAVEELCLHGLNVIRFQLVTGRWRWHVVGCYIPPRDALTIEDIIAAIRY